MLVKVSLANNYSCYVLSSCIYVTCKYHTAAAFSDLTLRMCVNDDVIEVCASAAVMQCL
jgi:hypothetical protein